MIETFQKLCWRFCILLEETYGISECLITLHSLTHLPEDIARFSSPDNFWCFQLNEQLVDMLSSPVTIKVLRKALHGKNRKENSSKLGLLKRNSQRLLHPRLVRMTNKR